MDEENAHQDFVLGLEGAHGGLRVQFIFRRPEVAAAILEPVAARRSRIPR